MLPQPWPDPQSPADPPAWDRLPAGLWRGDQLATSAGPVIATGYPALDAELPGGGWPCRAVSEMLVDQPAVLEWRLVGPALVAAARGGHQVVLVGPPRPPHVPGLEQWGLDARHLVWVDAQAPAQRLWCTEQLMQADGTAVVAWLPQVRPDQLRRLQIHAQAHDGLMITIRPAVARHEPSAAPLRVYATLGPRLDLQLQVLKRRGPAHDGWVNMTALPPRWATVLATPGPAPAQPRAADVTQEGARNVVGSDAGDRLRAAA